MAEIRAVVAAAGRGSRAGLPYPKTLFPIQGRPILLRIMDLLIPYDTRPSVIVSPEGESAIRECLTTAQSAAHLVTQHSPRGMGDAVLQFAQSPASGSAEHVLLLWGDIPFIQAATLATVVRSHFDNDSDFTFATRCVEQAYTVVTRDALGHVIEVVETREAGVSEPGPGERDIGVFAFRKDIVLPMLQLELPGKWGAATGEHGFLYIIGQLVARGYRVAALPIATELDLVSLNSMSDIDAFLL